VACPDDNQLVAMLEHPTQFVQLEVHMDSCEDCRKMVAALANARTLALGTPGDAAPASEDLDIVGDRYVISRVLGRGGMGTVYLAKDRTLGREVALKVHRAGSGNERLQREALAMAKLAHPNVVTVFEIGSFEDRLYVAMEYVRGGTLRDWLAHGRTWQQVVAMLLEIGAGLAAAHDAGLVHRDLKPENILVGTDGRPRVSDFGLARVGASVTEVADVALDAKMTVTGAVVGTPAYMAPEQLAGELVDARSDQFAFCVVAWEALFGKRPWGGATLKELEKAIHEHELASSRDVPERVRRVFERGLAIEPADRYPDVRALLAALRDAIAPRTRWWIAAAALGTALIVGGSYAGYTTLSARRHEEACVTAGDEVRALLSPQKRAAIKAAFAASGAPFADSAFEHSQAVLVRYADSLASQVTAVCRDDKAPAYRRTCLDGRRAQLTAYLGSLAHADVMAVERAPDMAWSLLDASPCDRPDSSPALSHGDVEELARLRALASAGKYKDGVAAGEALVAKAHAANNPQLELAALFELADCREQLDAYSVAPLYHEALALAESLGRDVDAARALLALANVDGVDRHDYAAAHADFDLAKAKLARTGDVNLALRGSILLAESQVFVDEARLGEAEKAAREGATQLRQALGPDHPKVGIADAVLAQALEWQDRHDEALAASLEAERVLVAAYGEEHPIVAGVWMSRSATLVSLHKTHEAREILMKADAVFAKIYGDGNDTRAKIKVNLAELDTAEEKFDAAAQEYRDALAIVERVAGPGSQEAGMMHRDIAYALGLAQKLDEAITEAQKGIAILDALGSAGEPRMVGALSELAEMYVAREHADDVAPALAAVKRAVAIGEKRLPGSQDAELVAARAALEHARAFASSAAARRR
jgi:predicted Ser/Thr protein kinase